MRCECGKDALFKDCCGRFLEGNQNPETCEELMRSRFVAFGLSNFDYIEATQLQKLPDEVRQRQAPEWESLEILSTSHGQASDETGTVEFMAYYREGGIRRMHHETSRFVRLDGEWRYDDGENEVQRAPKSEKVGRNSLCPCGSGKKFKRCCGV